MDATHNFICQSDLLNPLTSMGMQMASILVLSHLFHLAFKVISNPGPVAHILAGLVLGPTGLSRIHSIRDALYQKSTLDYFPILGLFFSMIFMFQFGLQTDIPYSIRSLRTSSTIALGGVVSALILGGGVAVLLSKYMDFVGSGLSYGLFVILTSASAAPPAVIRLTAELKIATSEIGRLAVSSSLINDMACFLLYSLMIGLNSWKGFGRGLLCLMVTVGTIFLNKHLAFWFNRRNRNQKYLKNTEVFILLSLIIVTSMVIELMSYSSAINCFLLGLMFPREGKSARTLLHKLTYSVNTFILPIYFGYIGFQFNGDHFKDTDNAIAIVLVVMLSIVSKVGGTLAACQYLRVPLSQGTLLSFLLNLKGHADLVLLSGAANLFTWTTRSHDVMLMTIVTNMVISGPVIAVILKKQEMNLAQAYRALELQDPENELRVLTCVYSSRHVSSMVGIIATLRGSSTAPITAYLMHLIELPKKHKSKSLYHELENDELLNDEDDYGGNDVLEINAAVDAFVADSKVMIHQVKAVSSFGTMYEDVCDSAEDLRVSIIILPFHKHQRIDGKMESGKEGIRTTNQRVLRHAPCSVGIIVNRGPGGVPGFTQILSSEAVQHAATLFFGGPDDQEALACSKRIATHPSINLTVIRFMQSSSSSSHEKEAHPDDDVYLSDFYNRFIRSGQVGYVQKQVNDGAETLAALKEIGDMYSLFIVGKGRRGNSSITTGISDWEECPELGTVGDVLASSEFNIGGSVLIVQQHRNPNI